MTNDIPGVESKSRDGGMGKYACVDRAEVVVRIPVGYCQQLGGADGDTAGGELTDTPRARYRVDRVEC